MNTTLLEARDYISQEHGYKFDELESVDVQKHALIQYYVDDVCLETHDTLKEISEYVRACTNSYTKELATSKAVPTAPAAAKQPTPPAAAPSKPSTAEPVREYTSYSSDTDTLAAALELVKANPLRNYTGKQLAEEIGLDIRNNSTARNAFYRLLNKAISDPANNLWCCWTDTNFKKRLHFGTRQSTNGWVQLYKWCPPAKANHHNKITKHDSVSQTILWYLKQIKDSAPRERTCYALRIAIRDYMFFADDNIVRECLAALVTDGNLAKEDCPGRGNGNAYIFLAF